MRHPSLSLVSTALAVLVATLPMLPARAELHTETVNYQHGDARLQGYLVWDDAVSGKRPGVLVVHEWWGLNDYAIGRAEKLAKAGYVAFAADMYGKDQVTRHPSQAKTWMQTITRDVADWRRRAEIGLEQLKKQPLVDPTRVAAVGYCFGGATVMQLAYSGADLAAVVSLHGSLPAAAEADRGNIKASILAFHGDADQFVPQAKVDAFEAALRDAGADWQLTVFGGVRHAFTNPDAGAYGIDNLKYDATADALSWAAMLAYFEQVLKD